MGRPSSRLLLRECLPLAAFLPLELHLHMLLCCLNLLQDHLGYQPCVRLGLDSKQLCRVEQVQIASQDLAEIIRSSPAVLANTFLKSLTEWLPVFRDREEGAEGIEEYEFDLHLGPGFLAKSKSLRDVHRIPRVDPYLEGVEDWQKQELHGQTLLIGSIISESRRVAFRSQVGAVGRNEQCPCGSGRKFKKCHGT